MYEYIMVRYGDLTLKGRNQKIFIRTLNQQLKFKLSKIPVDIEFQHDLIYIKLNDVLPQTVIDILDTVAGLSSYSLVVKTIYDLDVIANAAVKIIQNELQGRGTTFKVETKRADKTIPLTSQQISVEVSKRVLPRVNDLTVDVHRPEMTLDIEVRRDATYIYLSRIPGMGGFPVSIGGKSLVLLSGGIDSPVAAYLAMKKGLTVECIHFESTPLTSIESAQKVIDLTEQLAKYAPEHTIRLHMVPFRDLHEQLMIQIPDPYIITIMRRMMYRIATTIAEKNDCLALVSGDSIGQVASQTLESMHAIMEVTNHLILRPLASYDKMDIVKIAEKIGTLEISNRPFSDCCTVYVPKSPVIKPTVKTAKKYERLFDFSPYLERAINQTKTICIHAEEHLDIQSKGLIVSECI